MAVNRSRSLSTNLDEGATDGKYLKQRPDTGGQISPATERNRLALHDSYYGTFAEAPIMLRGDAVKAKHEH